MDAGRHPNITLLSYSEVEEVSGYLGNFTARVRKRARSVNEDVCTGCGLCQEKCPRRVVDTVFEAGLGKRKAIYVPFPQAVPNVPVIDKEHCRMFTKGKCSICQKLCPSEAVNYEEEDEIVEDKFGAIVLF